MIDAHTPGPSTAPDASAASVAAPPSPFLRLFREADAARLLTLSVETLRRERRRGRIGFARLSGRIVYSEDQLLAYVAAQRVEPTPQSDWGSTLTAASQLTAPGPRIGWPDAFRLASSAAGPPSYRLDAFRLAQEILGPPRWRAPKRP